MRSIRSRLTIGYAFLVTLTLAGILLIGRWYLESSLMRGLDLLNEVEYQEIESRIKAAGPRSGDDVLMEAIRGHAELDAALYFFQVSRVEGEVLYRSSNLGPFLLPRTADGSGRSTITHDKLGPLRVAKFRYADLDIQIASSLEGVENLFRNYTRAGLYGSLLAFAFSLAMGYGLSALAMRPVAGIQRTAQRITASNFKERIPVPRTNDEIARMAGLLNAMLDRLERAYDQVRRFTAEASHEFRTPLSIIRLQAERLLERGDLSASERESALQEQMEEIERLNSMIDDLLLIAKADAGVMVLNSHDVDLTTFLDDFSADARLLAEEKGITFWHRADSAITWPFDPAWIRRVLLNLLSNSLEASACGSRIDLLAEQTEEVLVVRLQDEGPGLPEDMLRRVFNRFERAGKATSDKGSGLGLSICQSIVERHGGIIEARNRPDRSGLIMEIKLPRDPARAVSTR